MMLVDCFDGVPLFFFLLNCICKDGALNWNVHLLHKKKKTFKTQNFYLPPHYFIISFILFGVLAL